MYQDVLRTLCYHTDHKGSHLYYTWVLHHDNARVHVLAATMKFLEDEFVASLPHPACDLDLAPADFCFLPLLKKALRGR